LPTPWNTPSKKGGPGHEDGVPFEYVITQKPGTPSDGNNQDGNNSEDGVNNKTKKK
jgi:hypothetical protein